MLPLTRLGVCVRHTAPLPVHVRLRSHGRGLPRGRLRAEPSLCPAVELKFNLDQYVSKRYPGLVKVVRNRRREGLIRARLQGWKVATAPVVGFFDAHVEFSAGW